MAWVLVVAAGLLETCFAVSLKLSDGFSRPGWTVALTVFAVGMLWLGDPVGAGRLVALGLVVAGVVGLRLTSGGSVH